MLRPQEGLGMLRPLLDEIVLEEAGKLGRGKNVPERKGACVCVHVWRTIVLADLGGHLEVVS